MARLTAAEKKLLSHPPTEGTWLCTAKTSNDGLDECGVPNSAKFSECWKCRSPKPAKPKLVWPAYLAACTKAGHTPGDRWRELPADPATPSRPRPVRRKGH